MTDDEILALALDHDAIQGGQHFSAAIAFARALIAQARAELTPVAWWNGVEEANDIEIPSFSKTPDAQHPYAIAIIPTKEGLT